MKRRIVRIERLAYGASVKSKHRDLEPVFGRVPTRSNVVSVLAGITTFIVVVLALVRLTIILGGKFSGLFGALSLASTLAVAFWCGRKVYSRLVYRVGLDRKALDERRIGAQTPGSRYVGISYCQGIWAYRDDVSWDRGFLSIDAGILHYRGIGPSFQLDLRQIRLLEVQRLAFCGQPFVRVHWTGEDGAANCLNLFVLGAIDPADAAAKADEMAMWIRDAQENPNAATAKSEPFASSRLEFCSSPAQSATGMDLALAYGASFLVASTVLGLMFAVERFTPGFASLLWIGAQPMSFAYRSVIRRRIKARVEQAIESPSLALTNSASPALPAPRT
ncbi:MAG TPA: hypothetical protein VG820_12745 [Fimbriimonadaceae bacterium]|nr:hypothetical protein [Fimbriimonadaceae bacterium]